MKPHSSKQGQLRIIGGEWRGRKLPILEQPGLRPTPDRVRETLFNWLQMRTPGARCLDLFAGTGALAFEAASRGASQVTLIEKSALVARQLQANLDLLAAHHLQVIQADALQWLTLDPSQAFDLVFLDPPYHKDLLTPAIQALNKPGWLNPHARIYLEHGRNEQLPDTPPNWTLLKSKRAGDVHYNLFIVDHV